MLGICNGFQVLCEAGLLPGALLPNAGRRFIARQVDLEVVNASTPFTHEASAGDVLSIPVKHGAGRYYAPDEVLDEHGGTRPDRPPLRARATTPTARCATSPACRTGRATSSGLMPHPEHAVDPLTGSADGGVIFASLARQPVAA